MKKVVYAVTTVLMGAVLLAGCAKKPEEMKYLKDFEAGDYVTLCDYKGIEVNAEKKEVTDEEVDEYAGYMMMFYTDTKEVTDRDTIQDGDIANIDYEGKLDGVAFEGGTAEGYDLYIGSGTFIEGFEEGLIGAKVGETLDLNLTFPEDYGSEELAGKAVVFTVKVNAIKEETEPELTDEFVASMGEEFKTVDEMKQYLRDDLESEYENERRTEIENQIQETLESTCTFSEAPSGFIDRIYGTLLESLNSAAQEYQMEVSEVAEAMYGVSADNYEQEMKDYCKDTLANQYLIIGAIAEKEGIKVSDSDVDDDIKEMLEEAGSTYSVDEYKKMIGDVEAYREYLLVTKVLDFLVENAKVNEN